MKLIELTQDRVACVNDEDFEWLSKWKWSYFSGPTNKTGYAVRRGPRPQRQRIYMHTAIMKRYKHWKHGKETDHKNTCGCDNRKGNLRLATRKEQSAHRGLQSNNTSGVTGVHWHKQANKWQAGIKISGKQESLGLFPDIKDAIAARRQAEIKHFGEYRYDPTKLCPLWKTGQCPDCAKRAKELGLKP